MIHDEAFQGHDPDRLIDKGTRTIALTWAVAGATANAREWVVLFDRAKGFPVAALGDKRNVALGSLVSGARIPAGRGAELLDCICVGNRLGI